MNLNKKKILISILILSLIIFIPVISFAEDEDAEYSDEELIEVVAEATKADKIPTINSRAAIVMDRQTGVVIYEKNLDHKRKWQAQLK